jgi:ribonucleoside-triphosphate reductase (thioredoxin)
MTGKIVQVGGVRRSSEISISDLDDTEMRDAKRGNWWETAPWLDMANNSATYMEKPDAVTFMTEWLALAKSGCGERGIFNRGGTRKQIPKRRKWTRFGLNPCGEVILRSAQMCNLSIVVARPDDTEETLTEKVRLATFFGTFQSTLTNFSPFLRPIWKQNCDEERLLGVDITGQMDCPILRPNAPGREGLLNRLRTVVLNVNTELAGRLGIPVSAAMTVVKPSGNSSMFFNCSSGMHTRWGRYQVRRFRLGRYNPIAKLLKTEGVPCQVDPLNEALLVFDFLPDPAPEGTPTRNDMTAVEQFHNWLVWKLHWTEHNPSCTLYVDPDEWLELGHEVFKHFDQIGGLTFLPKDSGTYQLAPNEELTQEEYERRRAVFPVINWAKLARYESDDTTNPLATSACEGGACEVTQCSRL